MFSNPIPEHSEMADDHDAAALALQLDDDRFDPFDHVHVGLARGAGVAVVQLVGAALRELLGVQRLYIQWDTLGYTLIVTPMNRHAQQSTNRRGRREGNFVNDSSLQAEPHYVALVLPRIAPW